MTEIMIADVKSVINRILDHIVETRKVDRVVIDSPFYWDIPPEKAYDINVDVNELDVGNLNDDWDFVSTLLDDKEEPLAYQLVEIAPILHFIGEKLGKDLAKFGG